MKKDRKVAKIISAYNDLFSNAKVLGDQLQQNPELLDGCKAIVEDKWRDSFGSMRELSRFKPSNDQTLNYFSRYCLFKLTSKTIGERESGWVGVTEKKLDEEFDSLRKKADKYFTALRLEPAVLWAISQFLLYYLYFSKITISEQSLLAEAMPVVINALLFFYTLITVDWENRSISRILRDCYLNYSEGSTLSHESSQLRSLRHDIMDKSRLNELFPFDNDAPSLESDTPKPS